MASERSLEKPATPERKPLGNRRTTSPELPALSTNGPESLRDSHC